MINADSMQVYGDLRILTARPSAEDERQVPHRLFGNIDGATAYSVSAWLGDIGEALSAARRERLLPIVVGGTGLYFKALTQGLSEIPPVSDEVRSRVREWAARATPQELHAVLTTRDPETAARLRPTDPQRITRALEVFETTGRSLAEFQERRQAPLLDVARCRAVALSVDRAILQRRLGIRLEAMVAGGALGEAEALRDRRLEPDLPVMRAVGVPQLLAYLAGQNTLPEAKSAIVLASRQYAKRQETFARHQLSGFASTPAMEVDALFAAACDQFA